MDVVDDDIERELGQVSALLEVAADLLRRTRASGSLARSDRLRAAAVNIEAAQRYVNIVREAKPS